MARVKIALTCSRCGKSFEHIHSCRNSADAATYEEWARANINICPACYAAQKSAEAQAKYNAYVASFGAHCLPEITGVSAKQIAFASSLREKFISDELMRYKINIPAYFRAAEKINFGALTDEQRASAESKAAQAGQTPVVWFRTFALCRGLRLPYEDIVRKIDAVFAEASASKIIDALR